MFLSSRSTFVQRGWLETLCRTFRILVKTPELQLTNTWRTTWLKLSRERGYYFLSHISIKAHSYINLFEEYKKHEWCGSLLKILSRSKTPRCRVHCVMIVLVERKCTDFTNKWSSLLETTYIYNYFNGGYTCVLIVRVQNFEWTVQKCRYWKIKCVPKQ